MADDPNPALRAELMAAIAVLDPQIAGLQELVRTSLEPSGLSAINDEITKRSHRRDLIRAVVSAQDAEIVALVTLEADGYPALPPAQIPGSVLAEMREEQSEIAAGIAVFEAEPVAVGGSATFPPPVPKGT